MKSIYMRTQFLKVAAHQCTNIGIDFEIMITLELQIKLAIVESLTSKLGKSVISAIWKRIVS